MVEAGTTYLRFVGPTYGFFGLGLALYFASQGAGRLFWPLSAGFLRMLVAIGAGWLALRLTGSLQWLFSALAFGLFLHGAVLLAAIASGVWFRDAHRQSVSSSPRNNPAKPHENLRVIEKGDLKCPSRKSTSPRANMTRLA